MKNNILSYILVITSLFFASGCMSSLVGIKTYVKPGGETVQLVNSSVELSINSFVVMDGQSGYIMSCTISNTSNKEVRFNPAEIELLNLDTNVTSHFENVSLFVSQITGNKSTVDNAVIIGPGIKISKDLQFTKRAGMPGGKRIQITWGKVKKILETK